MRFLPVGLNIAGRRIIVIGGGKLAAHKLSAITRLTKDLCVIAPEILPEIKETGVTCVEKAYEKSGLKERDIVYVCTDDREYNRRVCAEARSLGCLVNVADDPESCDFISPAVYRKGDMTVSVSSDGRAAGRAVEWRNRIRKIFEEESAEA